VAQLIFLAPLAMHLSALILRVLKAFEARKEIPQSSQRGTLGHGLKELGDGTELSVARFD